MATPEVLIRNAINAKTDIRRGTLQNIGEVLKRSITKNFQVGGRHNGDPKSFGGGSQRWTELSPSTKRQRLAKGRFGDTAKGDAAFLILVRQGLLRNSVTYRVSGDNTVLIGSNVRYAAIHHFGGMAGRGRKVRIPARPWLVIQPQDYAVIERIIKDEFS